jgi:hypothetical protein
MLDPEVARKVLREYHATTPIAQQIEDVRRWSPELAERLGLNDPPVRRRPVQRIAGFFTSFGQSARRLFS